MGAMPISGRRSRGEDGRPLRLRTPAIRRDGPTVQGPPAFSPAQCPRAGCRPILPQRTSGVMLKTPRVHASIWSRTLFQNAVFKLSKKSDRLGVFVGHQPSESFERTLEALVELVTGLIGPARNRWQTITDFHNIVFRPHRRTDAACLRRALAEMSALLGAA